MADMNSSASKKRNPNFSETEKMHFVEEYEKERTTLSAKFSPAVTTKRKHEAWMRVATAMNSRNSSVLRTPAELQKKWQNLCSAMKDEFRLYRKEAAKTGGGPPPKEPSDMSNKICQVLGEDDPTVHGIAGGINSLQDETCLPNPSTSRSSISDVALDYVSEMHPIVSAGSSVRSSPSAPSYANVTLPNLCPQSEENTPQPSNTRKIEDDEKTTNELHRELLKLEKEKCLIDLEKGKIEMEKEKLSLDIYLLKQKKETGHICKSSC